MDVTGKAMIDAQRSRDLDDLLHRVVRTLDDAGTQKQAVDVIALIEVKREPNDLVDGKPRPRYVIGSAVDAVRAIEDAVVREQDLQERHTAAVRRVAVANPRRGGLITSRFRRRARGVVL